MVHLGLGGEESGQEQVGEGGAPGGVLPSDVEEQVRLLRAGNQKAQQSLVMSADTQLSIADIRKMAEMQGVVGEQIKVFQDMIPALSPASVESQQQPQARPVSVTFPEQMSDTVFNSLDPEEPDQTSELARSEAEYIELLAI